MTPEQTAQVSAALLSSGKAFTFLFVTLGPLKVIGPFVRMTRGRDARFKRSLALQGILIAIIATLVGGLVGSIVLEKWGVSLGALMLAAGTVLFLVALRPLLQQFQPDAQPAPASDGPPPSASALAFTPLAFPTLVTPHGIAVLVLLVTLNAGNVPGTVKVYELLGVVLALDLLAMLFADRIVKTPGVAPALGILGSVLGILQVALGIQAILTALRVMGLTS